MFPNDKIIKIFSMCDDFSKNSDDVIQKNSIDARESTKKRKYHRDGTMSDAEVMTILVLFHGSGYRCLKHFYLNHVCKHMRHLFPKVVSYNRFVELQKRAVIRLAVFVKTILMGKCTGIESVNDELKNMAQIEHSRHRSLHNFVNNLMASIAAYSFFPKKPMLQFDREVDKQLTIY